MLATVCALDDVSDVFFCGRHDCARGQRLLAKYFSDFFFLASPREPLFGRFWMLLALHVGHGLAELVQESDRSKRHCQPHEAGVLVQPLRVVHEHLRKSWHPRIDSCEDRHEYLRVDVLGEKNSINNNDITASMISKRIPCRLSCVGPLGCRRFGCRSWPHLVRAAPLRAF